MDKDLFLPTLHWFAMNNPFTGSSGDFRFRLVPEIKKVSGSKEVDFESSCIHAQFWHGPYCYEKSTVEEETAFPLTEEGRLAMKAWLEENI